MARAQHTPAESPIRDLKITNLSSFQEVTAEPRQIAGLYFYRLLDCLVDLAYKVSVDFRNRPQLYKVLGDPPLAPTLAKLNAKYGTDVEFLSGSERNGVYLPLFGTSDTVSSNSISGFSRLRRDLVRSATAFVEGAGERGAPMLREAVRIAHKPFKGYLMGLHGDSVRFSKDVALFGLTEKICYPILRSREIATIFGVTDLQRVEYPYATDPAEDLLIEQIAGQLPTQADPSQSYVTPTRERISSLQSAALAGAEAIAAVIDFHDRASDNDLDRLISKCYIWGTTLASLYAQPRTSQSAARPLVTSSS
jgi:hypothetical protein